MIANRAILISGAGIAGLTLAYWLKKMGFAPTVIEKRSDLRGRGYMIDFYGSGYDVAENTNLVDQLRKKIVSISRLKTQICRSQRESACNMQLT